MPLHVISPLRTPQIVGAPQWSQVAKVKAHNHLIVSRQIERSTGLDVVNLPSVAAIVGPGHTGQEQGLDVVDQLTPAASDDRPKSRVGSPRPVRMLTPQRLMNVRPHTCCDPNILAGLVAVASIIRVVPQPLELPGVVAFSGRGKACTKSIAVLLAVSAFSFPRALTFRHHVQLFRNCNSIAICLSWLTKSIGASTFTSPLPAFSTTTVLTKVALFWT